MILLNLPDANYHEKEAPIKARVIEAAGNVDRQKDHERLRTR